MPIQIYHCDTCNADFTRNVSLKEDVSPSAKCPRGHPGFWKPPTGISFTVKDGTGAGKRGY